MTENTFGLEIFIDLVLSIYFLLLYVKDDRDSFLYAISSNIFVMDSLEVSVVCCDAVYPFTNIKEPDIFIILGKF